MLAPCRVFGLGVERAEVDGVMGRAIHSMKRDTQEALSLNVLASDIELDGAGAEVDALEVHHALTGALAEPQAGSHPVTEARHGAVVQDFQPLAVGELGQIGLEGSLLTATAGRGEAASHSNQSGD